ncbi:hypothetical protein ONE63_005375 [Megalurothrips usitatus]|uniref:protein-ribulosamine 3-kinase n=1 Tax=Megalurothrips usitatus TaxID=439358 RepID=A0AAV7XYG4_9NEOP|nr:hypothetical protein ONE63_005375 [Megalurothrips usitatus]
MEALLKETLNTSTLKRTGQGGGGCINQGEAFITDTGTYFVKSNGKSKAKVMFDGEMASLIAIAATNTVHVPKPIKVLNNPKGGSSIVLEYLEMKGLRKYSRRLGHELAKLHQHNINLGIRARRLENSVTKPKEASKETKDTEEGATEEAEPPKYITQFGFHTNTCCGYIAQENTWSDDWLTFFAQQRLQHQFSLLEKEYGDRDTLGLWSQLQLKLPKFFKDIQIEPSLLHGDLWGGNAAEVSSGPVVFDPASFYGHHEYELAIAGMFGGFTASFYEAYHSHFPRAHGFDSRHKLYQLFHYLNHWNHFGSGYKSSSMSVMRSLLKGDY